MSLKEEAVRIWRETFEARRTLVRFLLGIEPRTIDEHIEHLEFLIRRDDDVLRVIASKYNPATGHCCPSCASEKYRWLSGKQERRSEWLEILKQKKEKRDGQCT